MPCVAPNLVYRFGERFFFSSKDALSAGFDLSDAQLVPVRCGKCLDCRINYSRVWASRCVCEASLHKDNIFITLTYSDANLPPSCSLDVQDLQLFWKRLRKHGAKFRYFACGEYGSQTSRPHYHAIVFGWSPDDLDWQFVESENGLARVKVSPFLEKTWSLGNVAVGEVTSASCAYVARYCVKKLNDEELNGRRPAFVVMSRKPAIGSDFYAKYLDNIVSYDSVFDGRRWTKPPRVFENFLDADVLKVLKDKRVKLAKQYSREELDRHDKYLREVWKKRRSF